MKILSIPQYHPQYNTKPNKPELQLKHRLACDTVCFSRTPIQEKYPNYGKLPSRLEGYKFPEIKYIWSESPDFTNRILYDEIVEEDGEVVPRFIDYAVRTMINLHYEAPAFTEKLVKETKIDENGKEIYRFNEYDIKELVKAYKKAPDFTNRLVEYKTAGPNGKETERFSSMDIEMLVDMYLYNRTYYRDEDNDFINSLLEETYTNENGKEDYLWDFDDIVTIYSSQKYADNRKLLSTKDYAPDVKKVLVRIKDINNIEGLKTTIELVKQQTERIDNPASFAEILSKYNNTDLDDFNNYISNIDFGKLKATAPRVKGFNGTETIKFADYHYKNGDTELNEDNLKLTDDFTEFLEENYISADNMEDILTIFPLTERNIGRLPDGWLDKIPNEDRKSTTKKVYDIFTTFSQDRNCQTLKESLSETLNKRISVMELDSGVVGTGYRLFVKDGTDVVIKTFHKRPALESPKHGRSIEPQMGIFLNNNSDEYVHMYCGRVCGENDKDGFLVTQYLDNWTTPITGRKNPKYEITNSDANGDHNIINDKIIDFGEVEVIHQDGSKVQFDVFDIPAKK